MDYGQAMDELQDLIEEMDYEGIGGIVRSSVHLRDVGIVLTLHVSARLIAKYPVFTSEVISRWTAAMKLHPLVCPAHICVHGFECEGDNYVCLKMADTPAEAERPRFTGF